MSKYEELLSPELVEKGKITKRQIAVLGDYEIGILTLDPISKIKKHKHEENWEIYIKIPWGIVFDVCDIGNEHELGNSSYKKLYVLYIKGNNGVPIPDNEAIKSFFS